LQFGSGTEPAFSADGKTATLQMTNVSPSLTSRAGPRWTAESTPAFMDFRLVFKPTDDPVGYEDPTRQYRFEGFKAVKDATAGPRHPVWGDGYQAAVINYQFLAHAVMATDETVDGMR
jgi:hypothetical protein